MKIHELLKMTVHQYEMMLWGLWLEWCRKKAYTDHQVQILMCNPALHKWWEGNLEIVEAEFRQEIAPYAAVTSAKDAHKLYLKNAAKLAFYYSTPLITRALAPKK